MAYAAQVKAALLRGGVSPHRIVDLSHELSAHDVREAAFLVREMARGFPRDVVHLVVVDPGVGGHRAPIAIETRTGPFLVGPDNGVLYPLASELGIRAARRIDPGRILKRPRAGTTFDGRDLFAPAAARLAVGGRFADVGPRWTPTPYSIPEGKRVPTGARGEVLHLDHFGNLITSIPSEWVPPGAERLWLTLGTVRRRPVPWSRSYEALRPGVLGALGSSFGLAEVAVGQGRASDRLRAGVGSPVELAWRPQSRARGENDNSARPSKPH
jgi:hypothetical protein